VPPTEEEKKLIEILDQPEISSAAGDEKCEFDADEAVKSAFPELDPKAQKVMARVLEAEMPTPEDLEQAERIAQRNAEISKQRRERLAQRKLRQTAGQKGKKGKRPPRRRRRG
jgi:hypothetical protein